MMATLLATPERLSAAAIAAAWPPPPPVDYLAWAERNISFTPRESQFPGPYNRTLFPLFDEILRALGPDDPCRIVSFMKSAQLGGTVLANIFTLGSLDMDPGDFLYVHPTEDNARRWSKMKLAPMLRNTTALAPLFPQKSRDGSDSVLYKERADGRGAIQISGANSPAALSQVSMKRQAQDDLAKWEMNLAGDPEAQADSRSQGYEFAKVFKIGTPMVMPGCRMTRNYEAGSQEVPEVACPHCGEWQVLEWANMLAHLDEDAPEKAHFVCVSCGCAIEEHHRRALLPGARWRARNPKMMRVHRSFWLWTAYSLLQNWEYIARRWLAVRGDAGGEQTFMNDVAGLAWRTADEAVPWETLRDRAEASDYAIGDVPPGALLLTCGVDCQGDRVEWQVVGWGREFRRWVIAKGVFPGHISDPECQSLLDALLVQTWRNAAGRRAGLDMLAIDGNAWTEEVWFWARRHPASKVIMVRGANSDNAPLIERVRRERNHQGKLLKYSRRFYNIGVSALKLALYRNLAREDPAERGHVGLPRGLDDEFFRQLTAERRKPVKRRDGFTVYQWVKDPAQANEMLDTHLQAEGAALRLGVRSLPDAVWDRLESERLAPAPDEQPDLEDLMTAAAPPPPKAEAPGERRSPEPEAEPAGDVWIEPKEDWVQ